MSGASIEAVFEIERMLGALSRTEVMLRDSRGLMDAIGSGLVRMTQDRLGGTRDPWGEQLARIDRSS